MRHLQFRVTVYKCDKNLDIYLMVIEQHENKPTGLNLQDYKETRKWHKIKWNKRHNEKEPLETKIKKGV